MPYANSSEPFSCAASHLNGTYSIVVQVLSGALILYFRMVAHGTNSADVEGTQDSGVEDLFCGASPRSVPSLFFSSYPFSFEFEPVHEDFKHDLTCPHSGVAYIWF